MDNQTNIMQHTLDNHNLRSKRINKGGIIETSITIPINKGEMGVLEALIGGMQQNK
jgi:hypothetical protein